jgi:hypothetical protein
MEGGYYEIEPIEELNEDVAKFFRFSDFVNFYRDDTTFWNIYTL